MSNIEVTALHCQNCGAPLTVPHNSMGRVLCPNCGTENIVQGLVQNAEIMKKLDINSGLPLMLNNSNIHRMILNSLGENELAPLDLFSPVNVLAVKKVVVPAYYIYCTGTMNFTYDVGNQRERQKIVGSGDSQRIVTETYTEWTMMSGMVNASNNYFAPANRDYGDLVNRLFAGIDPGKLVDVEMLDYPYDVETHDNDFPVAASFSTYVAPAMNDLLVDRAVASLSGRTFRNVTPNGQNVQKDSEVRVFLGFYHIILEYQGSQYNMFITNDGTNCLADPMPIDPSRKAAVDAKIAERDSIKAKAGLLTAGFVVSIVVTAIFFFVSFAKPGFWAVVALGVAGIVVTSIFKGKKNKIAQDARNAVQAQIDNMLAAIPTELERLRATQTPLRGVLEGCAGDPMAF